MRSPKSNTEQASKSNQMKKTILLTAVALVVSGMANAQIRIGAGINTGLPMGADATDAEFGFGIGAGCLQMT